MFALSRTLPTYIRYRDSLIDPLGWEGGAQTHKLLLPPFPSLPPTILSN